MAVMDGLPACPEAVDTAPVLRRLVLGDVTGDAPIVGDDVGGHYLLRLCATR